MALTRWSSDHVHLTINKIKLNYIYDQKQCANCTTMFESANNVEFIHELRIQIKRNNSRDIFPFVQPTEKTQLKSEITFFT